LSSEEKADKEELKEALEQAFGPIVYRKGQGHGVIPDSVKQAVNEALSQAGLAPQRRPLRRLQRGHSPLLRDRRL